MKRTQRGVIVLAIVTCTGFFGFADGLQACYSHFQAGAVTAQMRGGMGRMMQQMMPDMVPPGVKPEDLPVPNSPGAVLLVSYCTQCHSLPPPSMHSAEEWPRIADRMFYRMSRMSGGLGMGMMMNVLMPTADEQKTIVAYLRKYAMKAISPRTIPSPERQGAAAFKRTCSQCHALPDPTAHTAREWPGIVEKMQAHMKTMSKAAMSEQEKKDILNYLARTARK